MERMMPFIAVALIIGICLCIAGWNTLAKKGYDSNFRAIWLLIAICTDGVLAFIIALLLPEKNKGSEMNSWVCMRCGRINSIESNYCSSCNSQRAGYDSGTNEYNTYQENDTRY